MGYVRLKLEGVSEVNRTLGYVSDIPGLAKQALQAGADVLLPQLKEAAPIGPGGGAHIRDRMEVRVKMNTAFLGVWDQPVAYYVEYGHGGPHPAPAHPYMKPTADAHEDEVIQAILDTIDDYLAGG